MFRKYLALVLTVVVLLTSCASAPPSYDVSYTEAAIGGSPAEATPVDQATPGESEKTDSEKMIERYSLYLQSENYEDTYAKIQETITKHDAFLDGSQVSNGQWNQTSTNRSAWFLIRVSAKDVNALLTDIRASAHVDNESLSKENVTSQYRDLENRRDVLQAKEARLLALMEKSGTMEELIQVETALGETIAEKESIIAQLNDLTRNISYQFVEVNLREVRAIDYSQPVTATFGDRVKNALKDTASNFVYTVEDILITLIYLFPFLIFLGIVVVALVFVRRKWKKRTRKEKANPPPVPPQPQPTDPPAEDKTE